VIILCLLAALVLHVAPAAATDLVVFAAASLTDALKEIGADYEKATGDHVTFNFGASSMLALQIQEGAPADVFFSADEARMDALEKRRLIAPGTRRSVLSNTLVVVVPADAPARFARIEDLAASRFRAIAIADPLTVPAGIYAKQYLRSTRTWGKVVGRLIPTDNVRAALAAVESGNVDAGIVYRTDALISKKVAVAFEARGPRISYPVAVVGATSHRVKAVALVHYLTSEPALTVFRKYGFLLRR
jgi:molybdate transport system substrate-binding protein